MRVMLGVALAFMLLIGSPQANAWISKKQYAEMVASWPAEGPRPSDEVAQAVALAYFNRVLKDPYSARYEWGTIEQGTFRGAFDRFGATGWILTVDVNAKNSYGAYVGLTSYKIVMRSNTIIEAYRYDSRMQGWVGEVGRTPIPPPADLPELISPSTLESAPAQAPCVACAKIGGG